VTNMLHVLYGYECVTVSRSSSENVMNYNLLALSLLENIIKVKVNK
jgi:hypothetical protein